MAVPPPFPATPPAMSKAELRAALRAQRHAFVEQLGAGRAVLEGALAERVLARLGPVRTLSGYLAGGSEIDCRLILEAAHARGIEVSLPCIEIAQDHLVFRHWVPGDPLMEGPLRLRQPLPSAPPSVPEVIVTPLLGFDRTLARIGQGKGFYDRTFASHPEARRIGIAWSAQETDALVPDPWDVPLHAVATEREWIGA